MTEGLPPLKPVPNRAPTLYAIIAYKLAKGILFAGLALALYLLSDNNLPAEYQNVLEKLNHHLRFFNPEKKFWIDLAAKIDTLTEPMMVHAAIGTLIYSLFSLVEGTGLMLRIRWIGWMTIGETAFFIPIEIFELLHKFSWIVLLITIGNIFILWYLLQNRERLFHHRHRHESKPRDKAVEEIQK
ncbi:MAG TPA: DUF2127 domain-containing protein [Verrucomicrobiae bacterium]|nr:DUF2127 domain-containing protein [Verrucomicrobiae bacterium]